MTRFAGIGVQSFGDDFFAHARAVGVRGVDEIDSQFDGTPQDTDGLGSICGLAPNSLSRDAH